MHYHNFNLDFFWFFFCVRITLTFVSSSFKEEKDIKPVIKDEKGMTWLVVHWEAGPWMAALCVSALGTYCLAGLTATWLWGSWALPGWGSTWLFVGQWKLFQGSSVSSPWGACDKHSRACCLGWELGIQRPFSYKWIPRGHSLSSLEGLECSLVGRTAWYMPGPGYILNPASKKKKGSPFVPCTFSIPDPVC